MKDYKFCPICGNNLIKKTIEGREYPGCSSEDCGYIFWNNPIPVVAAIIEINGEVLLARNKQWPEKMFGLITGFLEKGETSENAIVREVKEELNLVAKTWEMIGIYSFFEMNQLIIAYHVKAEGEIVLGDELAEYRLVPIDRLKPWPFGTGHAVKDWLQKKGHY